MELFKVIYAHGVHSGGGLTLLKEVFTAVEGDPSYLFILDKRCFQCASQYDLVNVKYFFPGLIGRLSSEIWLKYSRTKIRSILSFNSLPFIIGIKTHTTIFFQNINLIDLPIASSFSQRMRKVLFKLLAANVDQFVVQTRSIYDAVFYGVGRPCRICTLLEPKLMEYISNSNYHSVVSSKRKRFVYVADALSHKNHAKLLQAWQLLHETFNNLNIELILTLPFNTDGVWDRLSKCYDMNILAVTNKGFVSRERIFEIYKDCDALIFPSLGESLGLPLLEAASNNLDIIASELDFVRDVAVPVEVFNPSSKISIARSIARYLELPWPASVNPMSALKFLNEVFDEQKV